MSSLFSSWLRTCALAALVGPVASDLAYSAEANTVATTKSAADCCQSRTSGKRAGDQIWLVCTRHLGCDGVTEQLPDYRVQYFAQDAWHHADAATLLSYDDPTRATVIYVHGNRYSAGDAIASGWEAYHALTRCAADQPVRFVIWSWPSDKQGGPIRDARSKSSRTLVEGYYLARLMTRIQPEVSTSIIGYSFGSRVALGAVHMAGGGQLAGRVVPDLQQQDQTAMYRVAMLAAGTEDDGLLPGQRFQMAMSRTEHLLNLYNPADPVLKRFHVINKWEKPSAMGYAGIYGERSLGTAAERITDCNVSGVIGKTHDEEAYFASERLMNQVRATVLWPKAVVPVKLTQQ